MKGIHRKGRLFCLIWSCGPLIGSPIASMPILADEEPYGYEYETEMGELDEEAAERSNFELSSLENQVTPYSGTHEQKIEAMRNEFQEGRFWNHASPNFSYPMEHTTEAPCDNHSTLRGSVRCNVFDNGAQCAGFAYLLYYKYHGALRSSNEYSRYVEGNEGIRIGDVIRVPGHSAFVWDIEGDALHVFEANYGGRCRIQMSRTIDRNAVESYYTPKAVLVRYSPGEGQGSKEPVFVQDGLDRAAGPNTFSRRGYRFSGWIVRRSLDNQYLYVKGSERRFFESDEAARAVGFFNKAVLSESFILNGIGQPGDELELSPQWQKIAFNVEFDGQGAKGSMKSVSFTFEEVGQIPKCAFIKDDMVFAGWRARNSKGQWLCSKSGTAEKITRYYQSINQAEKEGWKPVLFSDGALFRDLCDQEGETITMVAQWNKKPAVKAQPRTMNRLYNPNSGEHFYTASNDEKKELVRLGWKDEGTGWISPASSDEPVYRLYNPNAGDHHYTTNSEERLALVKAGWKDEGIGWYSDTQKAVPIYRQYNPNATTGSHNFTPSKAENDSLAKLGWKPEGVAWYGS